MDSFIARENGGIDWLPGPESGDKPEDYGYAKFFDSVDCLVMGRESLDGVLQFPSWPYEGKRIYALSASMQGVPKEVQGKVELYSESLTGLLSTFQSEGYSRIYVDGGRTIQSFLEEGLLTDITITTIPVLLGNGISLFGQTERDITLKDVETVAYPNGLVQSIYEAAGAYKCVRRETCRATARAGESPWGHWQG